MQKLIQKFTQDELDTLSEPNCKSLLQYMYPRKVVTLSTIDEDVGITEVQASWYFQDLLDMKYIQRYGKDRDAEKYILTYRGRQYVFKNLR